MLTFLLQFVGPMIFWSGVALSQPNLVHRPDNPKAPFEVSFSPGAIWACTVYTSKTETIEEVQPNGSTKRVPYAPRHCWELLESATSYEDDWAYIIPNKGAWEVWAELYYPQQGSQDVVGIESNRVEVVW